MRCYGIYPLDINKSVYEYRDLLYYLLYICKALAIPHDSEFCVYFSQNCITFGLFLLCIVHKERL